MYRAGLEWILGFRVRGNLLTIAPCIPPTWSGFEIAYRHGTTRYEIRVENPSGSDTGVGSAELDGQPLPPGPIALLDDAGIHRLRVVLGRAQPAATASGSTVRE
jgi:cyclic beta-1,2-glucan synthetase